MRALRLLGFIAALAVTSCGDDDNPDAVDVKNLKYADGLRIVDNGDGSVTLNWNASNFEKDFEGYNVYGAKMSDADIKALAGQGLEKGVPLQLLNDEGDPRNESKAILAKMNYDPSKPFQLQADGAEEASTESSSTEKEEEPKFSFRPIHQKNAEGEAILPTCYPSKTETAMYTCTNYTADNVDSVKKEASGELSAHGSVSYTVSDLEYDSQYCFLVFAVQDSGKEISQTSTNFECIRPKYKYSGVLDIASDQELLIAEFAKKCKEDKACPDSFAGEYVDTGSTPGSNAKGDLYIDEFSPVSTFTPGLEGRCGIKDLGYRPAGFNDPEIPTEAPTFLNEVGLDGKIQNSNGYSARGMSIIIRPNFMYILACTDEKNSKKAYYHWIHVNQSTPINDTTDTITVDMRLSGSSR